MEVSQSDIVIFSLTSWLASFEIFFLGTDYYYANTREGTRALTA